MSPQQHRGSCLELALEDAPSRAKALENLAVGATPCTCGELMAEDVDWRDRDRAFLHGAP